MCAKRYHFPDPLAAVTDEILMDHISPGARVVDLGCGSGRLLQQLRDDHRCDVLGVELDFDEFLGATARGIPLIRADLNKGLGTIPDGAFDFAVLSQTLQQVQRPLALFDEIFRIAHQALVVVPNFGHWKVRWQVFFQGRAPVTDALPYKWYESPNLHFLTMFDFRELASNGNFTIIKELPIIGRHAVNRAWMANLRAHSALYLLQRPQR
jgi:methionine biosynthesis protein MetW